MAIKDQKLAHTIAEFAQLSGLGRSFIYQEIKEGRLIVRKAGRRTLILHDEGQAWLAKLPVAGQRGSSPSTS
jgi:excisionase family DNA binding protein